MPSTSASEPAGIGAPDPAALARFRADLLALAGAAPDAAHPLGIAVSGGPDSLALLLLAHAAFPGGVHAATVDHGLRAESASEAAEVQRLCDAIGVPHAILAPPPTHRFEGNLQDQARSLRYALLGDWARARGITAIATGHQQSDVAESLLLRARRGSGIGGLATMRAARPLREGDPSLRLVRPLLCWSRGELAHIVAQAGLVASEDPSNHHPRFDRARIRALIAGSDDLPADRLALAARNLRDAEDALDWMAEREWAARSQIDDALVTLDIADLPVELRRRLALRAIRHIRVAAGFADPWTGTGIDAVLATVASGTPATLAEVLIRPGKRWKFVLAPPRRSL